MLILFTKQMQFHLKFYSLLNLRVVILQVKIFKDENSNQP